MRCKRPQDFIASCWFVGLLGFFVLKILQQIASCHLRTKLQNRFCPLSQVGPILKYTPAFFYSCFLLQFCWDVSALSGDTRPLRYCVSGVVSPDCCFLEEPIPREETIGFAGVFFGSFRWMRRGALILVSVIDKATIRLFGNQQVAKKWLGAPRMFIL